MADQPLFALENVTKRFGDFTALHDVSLTIARGERVALIGPSGAGKSTLLGLLNGSHFASEGAVWVDDQDLATLSARQLRAIQRQIGTIYQQFQLVNNLRVIHNVNAGHLGQWSLLKAAFSLFRPLELPTAQQALDAVGIGEKLYARTDQLSGGQQQRVAIARVLVQNTIALLADEPIASLDPTRGAEIMGLLESLAHKSGKTLVCSVHTIDYVFQHFERAIGLRQGRIAFDMPVGELTQSRIAELYHVG